ncbi:MAG: hypothetical protein AB7O78_09900 [Thermoleophilia bacterium]
MKDPREALEALERKAAELVDEVKRLRSDLEASGVIQAEPSEAGSVSTIPPRRDDQVIERDGLRLQGRQYIDKE